MTWANPHLCKYCDNLPEKGKSCCKTHAKEQSLLTTARRKKKIADGLCAYGGCNSLPRPNRTTCASCATKKKRPTPEQQAASLERRLKKRREDEGYNLKHIQSTRKWQRAMLEAIFEKYGRKCNNRTCSWINSDGSRGCADTRCLQIDHVFGGGVKERNKLSYSVILRKVLEDETGAYQLLCANCNWIKRVENNESKRRHS